MKSPYKLALLVAAGVLVIVLGYYLSEDMPDPGPEPGTNRAASADAEIDQPTEPTAADNETDDTPAEVNATPTPPTPDAARGSAAGGPAPATTAESPFMADLRASLAAAQGGTPPAANQGAAAPGSSPPPGDAPAGAARANDALAVDGPAATAPGPTGTPPPATAATPGQSPANGAAPTASIAAAGAQQARAATAAAASARPTPPTPAPTEGAAAPGGAAPGQTATTTPQPGTYTIAIGDTFASIALKRLGDERRWVDIAQANPLVDPTKLKVGQTIRMPGPRPASTTPATPDRVEQPAAGRQPTGPGVTYTIESGDTLSSIAEQYYNDPNLWNVIYEANRDVIKNPDNIPLGRQIRIPPAPRGAQ